MTNKEKVAVIGAGVIGLTAGLEAQRHGFKWVTIYTDKLPLQTTSALAGAVFEPYKPGRMSVPEMVEFTSVGLRRYQEIIQNHSEEETGIRSHGLYAAFVKRTLPEEVAYLPAIPKEKWEFVEAPNVPGGYESAIYMADIPFIDPTFALPWLAKNLENNGGTIKKLRRPVSNLGQFIDSAPESIIFNCTGLGAKTLIDDKELTPMRGQIVVLDYVTKHRWSILGDDVYYTFPRRLETVLGGTAEEGEWAEETTPEAIKKIMAKARLIDPEVSELMISRTYAGLRPYRQSGARIEAQTYRGKRHVISTGFGGSGWTFCWGAAEKALRLATAAKPD